MGFRLQSTTHLYERRVVVTNRVILVEASIVTVRDSTSEPSPLEDLLLIACLALRQMNNLGGAKGQRLAGLLEDVPDKLDRLVGSPDLGPLLLSYPRGTEDLFRSNGPTLVPFSGKPAPKLFTSTLSMEDTGQFTYFLKHKGFGFFSGPMEESVVCSVMATALEIANGRGNVIVLRLGQVVALCAKAFLAGRVSLSNQREIARAAVLSVTSKQ